jgi:hypothetical protein
MFLILIFIFLKFVTRNSDHSVLNLLKVNFNTISTLTVIITSSFFLSNF